MVSRCRVVFCTSGTSVMTCIAVCRELDAAAPVLASGEAGEELCPESPLPCERLCWEIDARADSGLVPIGMGGAPAEASSTDLMELGGPLIACAGESARRCQAAASAGALTPSDRVSWTSALLECAGLSADFDLFD